MSWARLFLRVFGRDPTHCVVCGQPMRRVGEVMDPVRTWEALRWMDAVARGPPGRAGR